MPKEQLIFRLGVFVLAVHLADDNFFQPNPGTSAGDHLVSGLVPIGLLALAPAAYPRLRAGARAAVALPLGVFGIVLGVEAVYYAREVGLSGDDFTGLLTIPAGVALIGLGAVTLWRSRRVDDGLPRRYLRRFLLTLGAAAFVAIILFPVSLAYVVTHTARADVPEPELGAAFQDVSFTTSDGLQLEGWYIPSKNRAAVISFPGRKSSQKQARMLARHGYGVLLFDRRGEGESDGDPNVFGWAGDRDVRAAIDFLQQRPDVDDGRIGGIGLSVGGEMLLEAGAESDDLKAIVSEGAGARSIREDLELSGPGKWTGIPTQAFITLGTALFSNHTPPANLKDLVARIAPRPVFLIYGEKGQPTEDDLNETYYEAAGRPKALWGVPEAGHIGGITVQPREYERRVVAFFDRALLRT
jgi:uncharacterized protein